jgi:uncharacterized protein (DUF433 family)
MVDDFDLEDRITISNEVMGGKPVIKGRRVPIQTLIGALAGGTSMERVCEAYRISNQDLLAALSYAAHALEDEGVHVFPSHHRSPDA